MQKTKTPLYRRVNTKARGVHHKFGGEYRFTRNSAKRNAPKMKKGVRRGLDYTPLYKFLLSKVGEPFDAVYSEAVSRLDSPEPIASMVCSLDNSIRREDADERPYFRSGESTYFSLLFVDENGLLQFVNPTINAGNFKPSCGCCTHTFNGKIVKKKLPQA
ncbi:hypothetical protein [Vibrio sp. D431a]|uniref:hypothetical protein n=1 Tax=Vibrio sp. D431a TaxID=2837388 RepID=UPI002553088E|nr:hypothetical protein [Vibrio sp. D431a]MDK9793302.1 hypothetical protein [Vibrio sp. D431a]